MKSSHFSLELSGIRSRTKKSAGASVILHVALFLWLYMMPGISPEAEALVEINWVEPVPTQPAARESRPLVEKSVVPTRSVKKVPEYFKREPKPAEVSPEPQVRELRRDKIERRLTSLQRQAVSTRTPIANLAAPNVVENPTLAGIPVEDVAPNTPGKLARGQTKVGKPDILRRTTVSASRPALAQAKPPQEHVTPAPAKPEESTASRTLSGASLSGPVADRPLLSYSTPAYPKWAKQQGIEGASTIYFIVLPDGRVKKNTVIEKTSGFQDFDRNAIEALLGWRFEPLGSGQTGEQWGRITFHYRLSDARSN